ASKPSGSCRNGLVPKTPAPTPPPRRSDAVASLAGRCCASCWSRWCTLRHYTVASWPNPKDGLSSGIRTAGARSQFRCRTPGDGAQAGSGPGPESGSILSITGPIATLPLLRAPPSARKNVGTWKVGAQLSFIGSGRFARRWQKPAASGSALSPTASIMSHRTLSRHATGISSIASPYRVSAWLWLLRGATLDDGDVAERTPILDRNRGGTRWY